MFSSNQKLDISCTPQQAPQVIDFVMSLSGYKERLTRQDNPLALTWQEPRPGMYVVGTAAVAGGNGRALDEGWEAYQFDYDPEILARVLCQWANKHEPAYDPDSLGDGSHSKGLRIQSIKSLEYDVRKLIRNPVHAVFLATPFSCFYHK